MFEATKLLFLFSESPLHAGMGRGVGGVDLPIQRERTTYYPMVQASGVKGCLRAEAARRADNGTGKMLSKEDVKVLFGPEQADNNASEYAGALAFGDARLLLFPVRSLAGVMAWVTSLDVLARLERDATIAGIELPWSVSKLNEPADEEAWVRSEKSVITVEQQVVLEEFSFTATPKKVVDDIGDWIIKNALPATKEYEYWRTRLPQKLCILSEGAYRDFVRFATEIQTHIKLDRNTKTVDGSGLWTTENLPIDSLLYSPIFATKARKTDSTYTAKEVLNKLVNLEVKRIQLGGDETTGQGIMSVCFAGGEQ